MINPTKAEEARAARAISRHYTDLERQAEQDAACIAELQKAVAEAIKELAHVKLFYDLRVAERDAAIAEQHDLERRLKTAEETITEQRKLIRTLRNKHEKLSEIVRMALSPEKYLEFREIVTREHPEL